ncbi:MAG: DUF2147 domain-containing protein [Pseudomonadales bacterium]
MIGDLTRGGLICALFVLGVAQAEETDVYGLWSGGDSLLSIEPLLDGGLSMTIVALKDAVYRPDEDLGVPGESRRDDRNPDASLRERPLLGLELLSGYRFEKGRWEGRLYDPESGNTYSSRMERDGPRLKLRGYVGVPMLGRTRYFEPVAQCDGKVRELLAASRAELVMCD